MSILASLFTSYSYSYLYVQRSYNWEKGSGWFFYKTSKVIEPNGFNKEKIVFIADMINLEKAGINKNIKEKLYSRKGRIYLNKINEIYKFRFSKPNLNQMIFIFKAYILRRILCLSIVKNILFYRNNKKIISETPLNSKKFLFS